MGDILWAIVIGFVVGLIAKFLTPGRDPAGFFVTIIIGVVGSLIATYGGQWLGIYQPGQPASFIGSLVGAIILLLVIRLVQRRTQGPAQ
jgi:uncharacterized membrane protein YeaQ/YmgE (transglycosylase-associated protein family)